MILADRLKIYEIIGYLAATKNETAIEYANWLREYLQRQDPDTFTYTCKDENSPSDEQKEDDGMEVPSAEKGAESDDLREEISTLWDAIDLLEKRIERLEDKVYG